MTGDIPRDIHEDCRRIRTSCSDMLGFIISSLSPALPSIPPRVFVRFIHLPVTSNSRKKAGIRVCLCGTCVCCASFVC
eukprot:1382136-Amorphochlora_amoeboformis.AAC.1